MKVKLKLLIPPALGRNRASARAELLGSELGRWLDREVTVEIARDYDELERQVLGGTTDLAWAPPSLCARLSGQHHGIFKAVRNGRSTYRSAILARTGEARDLESLRGKRAIWVDPLSTGGYLLPDAYLRSSGIDPESFFAEESFAGSYQAALLAVADGKADVTAVHVHTDRGADLHDSIAQHAERAVPRLSVVAVTGEVGADGLVVCSGLPLAEATEIVKKIEAMQDLPGGPPLIVSIFDAEALELAKAGAYRALLTRR
ncbi:MAG: PhnD/SsuA/transferrin family substrate-binding protein [Deltaproteobacteria bacterium]|nr:PhnD/SsuA/transferrin family substrate-binding protein [Deltaproteobacteria bacterium]